jgi:hypothetical protein
MRMAAILEQLDQQPRQRLRFICAGLEQVEKLRVVTKVLLNRKHPSLAYDQPADGLSGARDK